MRVRGEAAAALVVLLYCGQAGAQGNPEAGKLVFEKCHTCHSARIGVNKIGPSLWGVLGRRSATVPDFMYSEALRAADKVWDAGSLDVYLADPRHVLNGTRMMFKGLDDPRDRADVIAYLATLD